MVRTSFFIYIIFQFSLRTAVSFHQNITTVRFTLFNLLTITPPNPLALQPPAHVQLHPFVLILDFLTLSEPIPTMSKKNKLTFTEKMNLYFRHFLDLQTWSESSEMPRKLALRYF